MTYIVYITSEAGDGVVNDLVFNDLDDIRIFTANIGRNCLITIEKVKK